MDRIVILGAGELGGLLAHALARRGVAHDVCLIDDTGHAAEGKALDIMQAAPVEGFTTNVVGSSDSSLMGGATVVAIADAFAGPEWQGDPAMALLRRLRDFAPQTLIVCVGALQRELVERGIRELHIPRTRLIGSAPEALVAGVRAVVAARFRTSPRDVALTAIGVPPDHIVIPWEDATVGGFALHRRMNESGRREIDSGIVRLWPPGPFTLASAAAKTIDTMLGRSNGIITCFVAPDDSGGRRARAAALPVVLSRAGIVDVLLPDLNARDRVRLDNAMML